MRLLDINTPGTRTVPCIVLDGTAVNLWQRCHQQYAYQYHALGRGVVPKQDNVNLIAGGAAHAALEVRYRLAKGGPVPAMIRAAMKAAQEEHWTKSTAQPDWRSPDYTMALLDAYLAEYPTENFAVREVEAPFARRLGQVSVNGRDWGVIWQGRRDLAVAYAGAEGQEWVMDHKTASSDFGDSIYQWGQNISQLGYVWSRRELTGRMPQGFIINMMIWRKPTVRRSELPRFEFSRLPIGVQEWQILEWQQNMLSIARNIIDAMQANVWPKSGNCMAYGTKCPFWEACLAQGDQRLRLLDAGEFKVNDWTPIKPE